MSDPHARGTVDAAEIRNFEAMADDWWDPAGRMAPLHRLNPTRLAYLKREICRAFGRDVDDSLALAGLRILDIGCGGGLVTLPLARLGADMVGVDAGAANIAAARAQAERMGVTADWRADTAEALAAAHETFDVVVAMEIVEHVADLPLFLREIAKMVRPGGLLVLATLNRTLKSFALAIVGAEYVLRWLPPGTHTWSKFVTPKELNRAVEATGLAVLDACGMVFDPLAGTWSLKAGDLDVNYLMVAERPAAA
ncbi:bifunctional 2-polyprenyl-6-hydroxyphenol methylase/3-demethylubiquinol 3-O-methyltransferase UbiG [Siculibacillus lacustris]|uniref:Ubiquinone biosynthesis O-methyltransferase n=1 Tax=Siculibacillus lacustris TaxID=1549641 RepID=A0A4Q9VW75_9HYPH|nr:bifunctional 2-polyprenyl-6-hydroxyphenol methylase/3-demethylubiquinol 3-O-methyltransferase UbiG [Siculibacillus lacustris]TBW40450.1 bifunctional 2-polyprenyl-6-hydroxyphenol methylase/3-demethylubiquinol 3-O-methyltransferase UbiG [Siculibacillus lacustris]